MGVGGAGEGGGGGGGGGGLRNRSEHVRPREWIVVITRKDELDCLRGFCCACICLTGEIINVYDWGG